MIALRVSRSQPFGCDLTQQGRNLRKAPKNVPALNNETMTD
jgi:hypothetical protein